MRKRSSIFIRHFSGAPRIIPRIVTSPKMTEVIG